MIEKLLENNTDVELWIDPPENQHIIDQLDIPKRKVRDNFSPNPLTFIWRLGNYILKLKKHKPYVIHCHTTLCSVIPLLAARIVGTPVRIYHNHGFPYLGYKGFFKILLLRIERINISNSTHFFTVSHSNKNELLKSLSIRNEEPIVFGGGSAIGLLAEEHPEKCSTPEFKTQMRHQFNLESDQFIVGLIGRPHHRKGFHFMVEIWNRYNMANKNAILVIAGCSEEDLKKEFPVKDLKGIQALGFVPDVDDFISALDVLVLPSNHEGFGNTMIEAGARFRPAIGSNIPGIQCTIVDGETGFLFEKYNHEDFYKKLMTLFDNPILAKNMGVAGRKFVMERFSSENVLGNMLKFYQDEFPLLFSKLPSESPLVSVITPTFNRVDRLKKSIDSALNQTYSNFELIVIDDGSSDGTAEYVKGLKDSRIKYLYKENEGSAGAARNHGILEASGELVAFLDSDDEWTPNKLEDQVKIFAKTPHLSFSSTSAMMIRQDSAPTLFGERPLRREGFVKDSLFFRNYIITSSTVVRKKALDKAGLFNTGEKYKISEDLDLWIRLAEIGSYSFLDKPNTIYHFHTDNLSSDVLNNLSYVEYVLEKHLKNSHYLGWKKSLIRSTLDVRKFRASKSFGESLLFALSSIKRCWWSPLGWISLIISPLKITKLI